MSRRTPRCPICRQTIDEANRPEGEPKRSFCSERCRLVDLSRWLDGGYSVPALDEPPPSSEV